MFSCYYNIYENGKQVKSLAYQGYDPSESEEPKKKKRSFFHRDKERDDVRVEDIYTKHDLKGFFISLKLHFREIVYLNIISLIGNFPFIFALLGLSGVFRLQYTTPTAPQFSNIGGLLLQNSGDAYSNTLHTLFAFQTENAALTTANWICFMLAALMLFTFGLVNVGVTYVLRELVRGKPVFIWDDFWEAVKKNWKQAFFFGIFDLLLIVVIPYNLFFFMTGQGFLQLTGDFVASLFFWLMLFIGITYMFMRFYIYLQMVTFDLPIRKILKNSLIFSLLNIKRNLLVLVGLATLVILNLLCFTVTFLIPLGIFLPLAVVFGLGSFMAMYAAYFKVEEIMIDHSPEEAEGETEAETDATVTN